jgi:hypothetical protein
MRDIISGLDFLQAFPPKAAVTDGTAQVSNILDLQGFHGAALVFTTGTLTDADAVWSVLLEESDDGTTFTAVADADLVGTEVLAGFAFGDDNECRKLGYVGAKRYLRATIDDTTANTGNLFLGGMWLVGCAEIQPTTNPPALVAH